MNTDVELFQYELRYERKKVKKISGVGAVVLKRHIKLVMRDLAFAVAKQKSNQEHLRVNLRKIKDRELEL